MPIGLLVCASTMLFIHRKSNVSPLKKLVLSGFVMGSALLVSGGFFMRSNQSERNSTKDLIDCVKTNKPQTQHILVYSHLLPSAEFYSGKRIITLNNGYCTAVRETQFEQTDHWNPHNLNLKAPQIDN